MHDLKLVYRDQIIRYVLGTRPAVLATEADTTGLERICQRLAESEMACELLRAKGYGARGVSIVDMIKTLPEAEKDKP